MWTSTYSTYLNSIRILQNKVVKLLADIDWRHSSSSFYKSLGILKLDDMIKIQTTLFVHSHYNNKLPPNSQSYFTNVNACHSYATRWQACELNYHIPRFRSLLEEFLISSFVKKKKKAHRLEGTSVSGNSIKSFLLNRVIVKQLHFLINNLYKSII